MSASKEELQRDVKQLMERVKQSMEKVRKPDTDDTSSIQSIGEGWTQETHKSQMKGTDFSNENGKLYGDTYDFVNVGLSRAGGDQREYSLGSIFGYLLDPGDEDIYDHVVLVNNIPPNEQSLEKGVIGESWTEENLDRAATILRSLLFTVESNYAEDAEQLTT